MAKQYNIKWKRSDYSRLSHLIRKVNQKVFEIEVKHPDISGYQPDMLDYKEVKESIKTRRDLNNFINKYKRYLREGCEEIEKTSQGGVLTKWQKNEIRLFDLHENSKRARLAKKLGEKEVKIGGKSTGIERAKMGDIKENDVRSRTHNIDKMNQGDINFILRLMDKKLHSSYDDEMQHKMLENYVKGLISEGYSSELLDIMNKIPPDLFKEVVDTDEYATFSFIYDPIELSSRNELLVDLWKDYVDENIDNRINFDAIEKEVQSEYERGERMRGKGRMKYKKSYKRRR